MSFSVDWLRLREPHDHAARSLELVRAVKEHLGGAIHVLDLGCGLGSGLRFCAPALGEGQRWTLVDHDEGLLRTLSGHVGGLGVAYRPVQHDLRGLQQLGEKVPLASVDLVHTQALLDLVSHRWLEGFVDWLAAHRLPLLAALTVDGRVRWSAPYELDDEVQSAFRAHQHLDRGFGPSPGPEAATVCEGWLNARGYVVERVQTDWVIGPEHRAMLRAMVEGTAAAARVTHEAPDRVARWEAHRLAAVEEGSLSLQVGHVDLWARHGGV